MSAEAMEAYLKAFSVLSCNVNPYLPSLSDIGCGWGDFTELLELHRLFCCKVYRKRTVYLSPEVYFLLKQCRKQKPLGEEAAMLYRLLEEGAPLETEELKPLSQMEPKIFSKAMDFLMEQCCVTAIGNGRYLNPTWSTLKYGTAEQWEAYQNIPELATEQGKKLYHIFLRSMQASEVEKLLR